MKLADMPQAFQQWCQENGESFDGIPEGIQLAKVHRYRNGNLFMIRNLQNENEEIIKNIIEQVSKDKVKKETLPILF